MPASSTSPAESSAQAIQREKSRQKQQRYRDRKKAQLLAANQAKEADERETAPGERNVEGGRSVKRKATPAAREGSSSSSDSDDNTPPSLPTEGMRLMAARLKELGVGEDEIRKLASGRAEADERDARDVRPLRKFPALLPAQNVQNPVEFARPDLASSSLSLTPTSSPFEQTPACLFAGLLNDALPLPRPEYRLPPTPRSSVSSPSSSCASSPPTSDLLRQALNIQTFQSSHLSIPRELPSYTYQSPVSLEGDGRPLDWKISLFELHRTCHAQRHDPVKGYLHNEVVRQITAQAQAVIVQLLGPSSRMEAFARLRRPLTEEEEIILANLYDPRLADCADRVSKLALVQAAHEKTLDLTEFIGIYIEECKFFSEPYDMSFCHLPQTFYDRLPATCMAVLFSFTDIHEQQKKKTPRGASIREIVLGLEMYDWRLRETKEEWKWVGLGTPEGEAIGGGFGGMITGVGGGALQLWREQERVAREGQREMARYRGEAVV